MLIMQKQLQVSFIHTYIPECYTADSSSKCVTLAALIQVRKTLDPSGRLEVSPPALGVPIPVESDSEFGWQYSWILGVCGRDMFLSE